MKHKTRGKIVKGKDVNVEHERKTTGRLYMTLRGSAFDGTIEEFHKHWMPVVYE
jgi:hypothetical protein